MATLACSGVEYPKVVEDIGPRRSPTIVLETNEIDGTFAPRDGRYSSCGNAKFVGKIGSLGFFDSLKAYE